MLRNRKTKAVPAELKIKRMLSSQSNTANKQKNKSGFKILQNIQNCSGKYFGITELRKLLMHWN